MTRLALIQQLFGHAAWADDALYRALTASSAAPDEALREYAHILGACEVWLSRMEQRAPRIAVWPTLSPAECVAFRETIADGYDAILSRLTDDVLDQKVSYTTSDGRPFVNTGGEILVHVAMHGQYHRGKVNLLLRQAEMAPAPADLIAFIRGASTATQASSTIASQSKSSQS
ncbi:MAG: DinB family protein [bacterium]